MRALTPSDGMDIVPHFYKVCLGFIIYAENSEQQELVVRFMPEDFNFEIGFATKSPCQHFERTIAVGS